MRHSASATAKFAIGAGSTGATPASPASSTTARAA
eukprot:CAMPEP_0185818768 /NCGR_PEP_ID=MMETSP1322-20130828/21164_1 /TAXON_ID=265543 /ORGANISM="Minutocellus polymorphus, Strain RCC2270" /LENGTH=34 /DNA_ID= /DNA_START= /DNA_END= /DNA_ORIENTATION=